MGSGPAVAETRQQIVASVERVFDALCDPRTYPQWLIGAKEIRAIDDDWPEPGSRFHHRVGIVGPLTIDDTTKVLELEPPRLLVLEVRARPFGRGQARFEVHPHEQGSEIVLEEHPIGALRPFVRLLDPMIAGRNAASLRKLAAVVEDGALERPEPSES
jgi:uncharacterized protein YndB with AHSA1/START domain